jgi:hypothetical protein
MTDEQIRHIVREMYDDKKSQKEMKQRLRCRGSKIGEAYEYWRSQGFDMRKSGEPYKPIWTTIIQAVADNLSWFEQRGIKPTVRAMFYRLYSLRLLPNTHNAYVSLSEETAIARRGYEWDNKTQEWKECTKYIKLDIHCFIDESRSTLGRFDDDEPEDPEDPEEYIDGAIQTLKDAPKEYDGVGDDGSEPGRWYNQDYYVEVWLEKQTLAPTFESFLKSKDVMIVPNKGNASVPFLYDNCVRLQGYVDEGKEVKVLYFGDLDPSGDAMDEQIKHEFELWGLDPDIIERVSVTQEQLKDKKFSKIPTDPDADTVFKLIGGINPKTGKSKKGDPRTPGYIDKYRKYIKPGHTLPPIAEVEAFLAYYPDEFKKLVQEAVDEEYWDELVNKEAMEEYQDKLDNKETIDIDNEFYDDTEITIREMMIKKITEAFQPGWKND